MVGKLIVIEGLEGAGKSTAVDLVTQFLSERNLPSIQVREPGGTAIGETLRAMIKNADYSEVLDDKSELLMLYTARIQLLEEVIKPALKQEQWVIADRFELSTLAYQGGGRGIDDAMIKQLSAFCLQGFKPDLTLYLDISPELGMQRAGLRGQFDRIEQQSIAFFYRVYDRYMEQLQADPDIVRIDAKLDLQAVQAAIENALNHFMEQVEQ